MIAADLEDGFCWAADEAARHEDHAMNGNEA